MTKTTLSSSHHAKVNPTPHPALLKQPLLGKRPSSSGPALNDAQQQQQQQPDQAVVCDSAAPSQQCTDAVTSIAQAELTARLQHMQSIVRGNPVPKLSVSTQAKAPSVPQPTASPMHSVHSVSRDTHSNQDTEMDNASYGSHGPSHGQASDSFKESAGDTKCECSNPVADAHDKSPHGSSRRSPAPFSRDSASPHYQGPTPFGDAISSRPKGAASSRDGASPRVFTGMPCRDCADQGLGMIGQSQLKLPSR